MTLLLLLIISCTILCSCGIPLDDFFPYGVEAGDSSVDKTLDDGSSSVLILPFPFRFLDTLYSTLYVNNNGHISFNKPVNSFDPQPFPIPDLPLIAPYWADVDTRPPGGGQVWYRISTDNSLMTDLIGSTVSSQPTLSSFTPEYLVIVTWDHVGYFNQKTDKTNTFQCILAADNVTSYVIYQYADDEIQWTTGSASGGTDGLGGKAALVGYNAGDCIRYKTVRESMTTEIINVTRTSNVGMPGVYVFKVDGTERCTVRTQNTTTTITKMVTSTFSVTIATNCNSPHSTSIATTTNTKTIVTSTLTAVTSATNTDHMTTTSTKTMVTSTFISVTTATNTPSICRPDHCPKVKTVLCGDNTAVVTGGIGGVMGLIILIQLVVIIILFIRRNVKTKPKSSTQITESEGEHKMVVASNSAYGVVSVREELQYEVIGLRQTRNHH